MTSKVQAGILLRCVACRKKRVLTFEQAAHIDADAVPTCEACYMPMVVESATIVGDEPKGKRR